jgi:guanylate kinase
MNETKRRKVKVVIVSGPSGVGKSTICKEVVKRLSNVYLSVSVTTRTRSEAEVDGEDYWFISEREFQERLDKGLLLEYAEVFGHLYGTP